MGHSACQHRNIHDQAAFGVAEDGWSLGWSCDTQLFTKRHICKKRKPLERPMGVARRRCIIVGVAYESLLRTQALDADSDSEVGIHDLA